MAKYSTKVAVVGSKPDAWTTVMKELSRYLSIDTSFSSSLRSWTGRKLTEITRPRNWSNLRVESVVGNPLQRKQPIKKYANRIDYCKSTRNWSRKSWESTYTEVSIFPRKWQFNLPKGTSLKNWYMICILLSPLLEGTAERPLTSCTTSPALSHLCTHINW